MPVRCCNQLSYRKIWTHMTSFCCLWLHISVDLRGHRLKPYWSPEFFGIFYAIAKIVFITVRITASLDFIFPVHYFIHFAYHFVHWVLYHGRIYFKMKRPVSQVNNNEWEVFFCGYWQTKTCSWSSIFIWIHDHLPPPPLPQSETLKPSLTSLYKGPEKSPTCKAFISMVTFKGLHWH